MSLSTETGIGRSNSDSYASIAMADTRCLALGLAYWQTLDESAKEVALRKATQFMLANYRSRWAGRRVNREQALDWPRYGVCVDGFELASNVVPVDVVNACIDLALRAASGVELLPDLDVGNNQVKRDKTGPLETEYFQNNVDAATRFVAIEAMLEPYFGAAGGAGMMKVVRA